MLMLKTMKVKQHWANSNINDVDNFGNTALMFASKKLSVTVVSLLLEKGADVNIKNNNGDTALIYSLNN